MPPARLDVLDRAVQAGLARGPAGPPGPPGAESCAVARPMPALAPVITTVCVMSVAPACFSVRGRDACPGGERVPCSGRGGPGPGQPRGRLEQQGVDERLGEVAAQLALADVVLLGEEAGWPAGGPVALEPADGLGGPALLVRGQRHQEPAQHERSLGLVQRPLVLAEPVHVAVLARSARHARRGWPEPGGRRPAGRAADGGQQQGGVDPVVAGGALPAAARVQAVRADVGQDARRRAPSTPRPAGRPARRRRWPAARRRTSAGNGPSAGCPAPRSRRPASPHRVSIAADGGLGRLPVLGVQVVVPGRGGEAAAAPRRARRAGTAG